MHQQPLKWQTAVVDLRTYLVFLALPLRRKGTAQYVASSLTDASTLLKIISIEQYERRVTFEIFDQSDEETKRQ